MDIPNYELNNKIKVGNKKNNKNKTIISLKTIIEKRKMKLFNKLKYL